MRKSVIYHSITSVINVFVLKLGFDVCEHFIKLMIVCKHRRLKCIMDTTEEV